MANRKVGQSPGTLVHIGNRYADEVKVVLRSYSASRFEETKITLPALPALPANAWVEVEGVHDAVAMRAIGDAVGVGTLELEDLMYTHSRPKMEERADGGFLQLQALSWDGMVATDQVSIWWKKGLLVMWTERNTGIFDGVKERLRSGKGNMRSMGTDYLAYALTDAIVDGLFQVLEANGERLAKLEEDILDGNVPVVLSDLQAARKDMAKIRHAVWPLRDVVAGMLRAGESSFGAKIRPFLQDVQDHSALALDMLESQRDTLSSLRDLLLNAQSQKMNEIMQVLTVIATIFIPLTFIAGVYGMNFDVMPELHYRYGYAAIWVLMGLLGLGMLYWFQRKGWLKRRA